MGGWFTEMISSLPRNLLIYNGNNFAIVSDLNDSMSTSTQQNCVVPDKLISDHNLIFIEVLECLRS